MKEVCEVEDVLCMAIPDQLSEHNERVPAMVYAACVHYVYEQYAGMPDHDKPVIRFSRIDTLITSSMAEAEAFQPAHDCATCREGAKRTCDYLRDNPEATIALANIYYTTVL